MSMQLIVCGGCARHIREAEGPCPFCGASAEAPGSTAGRAALMAAITVAAGLTLAACYGGPPRPRTYTEAQQRPGGATMQVATSPSQPEAPQAAAAAAQPTAAPQAVAAAPGGAD